MHALSLFSAVLLSLSTLSNIAEANYKGLSGFSIDLIHRDSPLSPFYNSSMTPSELIRNAAFRSISRANRFRPSNQKTQSASETDIIPDHADYLMRIFIGTPPVERLATADTGSDLIWVQCSPCKKCYPQKAPLFYSKKSSSYSRVSCHSEPCKLIRSQCGTSNQCVYYYSYADKSHTRGELAMDSINFGTSVGTSVSFPKSVFGCGRLNGGKFESADAGLVGLGNGPLSLVSQLGDVIGHKFSYCLLPFSSNSTSKLRFGEGTISGHGVVSTPLQTIPGAPSTFYILKLEGISVGQKKLETGQRYNYSGATVIDSGTTLTQLPSSFYKDFEELARGAMGLEAVRNPPQPFKLCYTSESFESRIKNFPEFVVHFTGADLSLKSDNLFHQFPDLACYCLAVLPTVGEYSFYGNVAQISFQVEYDLKGRKVSFAPADCTNY